MTDNDNNNNKDDTNTTTTTHPYAAVNINMIDSDRQLYFADYIIELQYLEEDKRKRIRDARRRAEKAQRDAYRQMLRKLALANKILPHTRWRNLEEHIAIHEKESYQPV